MGRFFCPPGALLQILQENEYIASRVGTLRSFGTSPLKLMVELCWEATWEAKDRLFQDDAQQHRVEEHRATHLEVPSNKLWASNVAQQQPVKWQQGWNAKQAATKS